MLLTLTNHMGWVSRSTRTRSGNFPPCGNGCRYDNGCLGLLAGAGSALCCAV